MCVHMHNHTCLCVWKWEKSLGTAFLHLPFPLTTAQGRILKGLQLQTSFTGKPVAFGTIKRINLKFISARRETRSLFHVKNIGFLLTDVQQGSGKWCGRCRNDGDAGKGLGVWIGKPLTCRAEGCSRLDSGFCLHPWDMGLFACHVHPKKEI